MREVEAKQKIEPKPVWSYPTTGLFLRRDFKHFRDAVESSNGICVQRIQRSGELAPYKVFYGRDKDEEGKETAKSILVKKDIVPPGAFYAELSANSEGSLRHFWLDFATRTKHDSVTIIIGPQPPGDTDTGKYRSRDK